MAEVQIPPRYRGVTLGTKQVQVDGDTVIACLEKVEEVYPGFLELVLSDSGALRKFARLFLNGEALPADGLATKVTPEDVLAVVTSAAGG